MISNITNNSIYINTTAPPPTTKITYAYIPAPTHVNLPVFTDDTSPDLTALIIGCIATISLLIVLIMFCWYLRLKWKKPTKFYLKFSIQRPSMLMLYYLQIIDLFMLFSQNHIIWENFGSWTTWVKYCQSYNYEQLNEERVYPGCDLNDHCHITTNDRGIECRPFSVGVEVTNWSMTLWFMTNLILTFIAYITTSPCMQNGYYSYLSDSFVILIGYIWFYDEWKIQYQNMEWFDFNWYIVWFIVLRYIWFFCSIIPYYFQFNGPNINYIEWYTIFPLFILWLFNEIIIKRIVYDQHPRYDSKKHKYFILEEIFGSNIAKIIWIDFLNEGCPANAVELTLMKKKAKKKKSRSKQ